jgi:tRNA (guanine-N7-)-methyltransferase
LVKPKDLPPPFQWESRRIVLDQGVLFMPECVGDYAEYKFPPLHEIFGNSNQVNIEYCSGNGDWVVEKCLENPEINWVAVEKRFDRCRKIWAKRANADLKNLFVVCGDAFTFTKYYVPAGVIGESYINFPDPWPKTRHAKHRLIREEFIYEVGRSLVGGGSFSLATDDELTSSLMIEQMGGEYEGEVAFTSMYGPPFYVNEAPGYGPESWFERLWRGKGKTIYYHAFIRVV